LTSSSHLGNTAADIPYLHPHPPIHFSTVYFEQFFV
jgi:hypothetical protein